MDTYADELSPTPPTPKRVGARWGWLVAVVVVTLAWAGAFALRGGGGSVELEGWSHGLEEGQAQAKEEDKPMLVLFTASWCGPCQVLKKDVLTQPEVDEVLRAGFVPVKVDMSEAGRDHPLIERYRLTGWPTLIAMTPEGDEIKRIVGLGKPTQRTDAFVAWLDAVEK